jgi:hypothetical protein
MTQFHEVTQRQPIVNILLTVTFIVEDLTQSMPANIAEGATWNSVSILWRRLDDAGHDACRLVEKEGGWRLEGAAVFLHEGVPACLDYKVDCDGAWRTREGAVHGWGGERFVDFRVTRAPDGVWTLNGQVMPDVTGCVDLDLGFTPATNLFQLRRVALQVGQAADVPVAWIDVPGDSLDMVRQRYERRTAEKYWYESPPFDYYALLRVNAAGFVLKYPDLWEAKR